MKIKIADIIIKEECYPRDQVNEDKILEYAENIDRLPPITINKDKFLIDGRHRIESHNKKDFKEIDFITEDIPKNKILERAIELNAKHGLQLSYREKQRLAIQLFEVNNGKHLAEILSVSTDCINKWVRAKREFLQDEIAESVLSDYLTTEMTQKEILDKHNKHDTMITELKEKILKEIKLLISKKDAASKNLKEKYSVIYHFSPSNSNVWSDVFQDDFGLGSASIDNKVLFKNLLYCYTEQPFDIIYDFTQTSKEVCRGFYRRYRSGETISKSPALAVIDAKDDQKYVSTVKLLKPKMKKEGYIAILTHRSEQQFHVYAEMKKIGADLVDDIVLPYPKSVGNDSALKQQGYENLLVFSFSKNE
jgi:ParB-like chromosome segregation protein Spo0J